MRGPLFVAAFTLACGARQGLSEGGETGGSGEGESGGEESGSGSGSGSGSETGTGPGGCVPGQSIPCACPGGGSGAQVCNDDGMSYGQCDCGTDETGDTTDTGDPGDCLPSNEPYPGDFTINAQADINEIAHYSVISGSLRITGNAVIDVQGMSCLQRIGNQLLVYETTLLQDLTGLDNLTTIQGEVEIFNNTGLTSLAGLPSLQTAGWFSVYENGNLKSVDEFPALDTITGSIGIDDNISLPTCNALSMADKILVGGDVCVTGNKADACEEVCG